MRVGILTGAVLLAACGTRHLDDGGDGGLGELCPETCSIDLHAVVDCHGAVVRECPDDTGCGADQKCMPACDAARSVQSNVGCEFWVPNHHVDPSQTCLAAYVVNVWSKPVMLGVDYHGQTVDASKFARVPSGEGSSLTWAPLPGGKLEPKQVAVVFLNQYAKDTPYKYAFQKNCPAGIPTVAEEVPATGSEVGKAFRIWTSAPTTAYDFMPFGGGASAITSASLLLPTASWDKNYVMVAGYPVSPASANPDSLDKLWPWSTIVAAQDDTKIIIVPNADIEGGGGVPAGAKGAPWSFTLARGEALTIEQRAELTGSTLTSDKPVALFGGHDCANVPLGVPACDSMHQQIPGVSALGHEYAAVRHRDRYEGVEEAPPWRVVGAVDGTVLSYDGTPPPGAPTKLAAGEVAEFPNFDFAKGHPKGQSPFVIRSQDAAHPFYLSGHMTGCTLPAHCAPGDECDCRGDPEHVNVIPTDQWLPSYVFFTDPTYSETNLVLVRKAGGPDVTLDCAGIVGGWQPIGDAYEYARLDLVAGDFQPQSGCNNGRHEITSTAPFALTVWGWGSAASGGNYPGTPKKPGFYTQAVSYAYPGGQRLARVNDVVVGPPIH